MFSIELPVLICMASAPYIQFRRINSEATQGSCRAFCISKKQLMLFADNKYDTCLLKKKKLFVFSRFREETKMEMCTRIQFRLGMRQATAMSSTAIRIHNSIATISTHVIILTIAHTAFCIYKMSFKYWRTQLPRFADV